mgnify:CR=1 FL=1
MPAPTALQRRPDEFAHDVTMEPSSVPLPDETEGELVDMSLDPVAVQESTAPTDDVPMTDESGAPKFPVAKSIPLAFRREQRKVPIPPHRMTPLKANWPKIYPPVSGIIATILHSEIPLPSMDVTHINSRVMYLDQDSA